MAQETNIFFKSVMVDVIENMTKMFSDEGLDEAVLLDLKQIWEEKYESQRPFINNQISHLKTIPYKNKPTKYIIPSLSMQNQSRAQIIQTSNSSTPTYITLDQFNNMRQAGNQPRFTLVNNQLIIRNANTSHASSLNNISTSNPLLKNLRQLDGNGDSSSDEDINVDDNDSILPDIEDEEDDDDILDDDEDDDEETEDELNSNDDISQHDATEVFECDNLLLCQYKKISRVKNTWHLSFKSGIMNIKARDYIFNTATGISDW